MSRERHSSHENGHDYFSQSSGHLTSTSPDQARRHRSSFNYDDERLVHSTPPESPMGFGGPYPGRDEDGQERDPDYAHQVFGDAVADGAMGNKTSMSTTKWLAQKHGVRHTSLM